MKLRTIAPVLVCVAAIGALLIGGLMNNAVYFRTVSEARADRAQDGTSRIRVAGAVVPGSVVTTAGEVSFELTDGRAVVTVHHHGDPPELFADGAPIVSEGHWSGDAFDSDRLMIKHGSQYTPPDVNASANGASPATP